MDETRRGRPCTDPIDPATAAPSRRAVLGGAAALALSPATVSRAAEATSFEGLVARAVDLASRPYAPPPDDLPASLKALSYDQYQETAFRPGAEIVLGDRFGLQLFHRGFLHRDRVALTVLRPGGADPVAYDPARFDARHLDPGALTPDLGHAGFRLHYAYEPGTPRVEFAVFLGASYFRLVGRGQQYGLSARGIAVGTGLPEPEEFPRFTEFVIEEPAPGAGTVTVLAALDGPSLAGAYRFRVSPGAEARVGVEASLHPRGPIGRLGLAPLTSMFLTGKSGPDLDDYRPEVHDSDGLLVRDAGGTVLRALDNPRLAPRVSLYPARDLTAFALVQRERDFAAYLDVAARHEDRPGLIVTPTRGFGPGEVMLYEINSREEYMDNVVAAFLPAATPRGGSPIEVAYELATIGDAPPAGALARATRARAGTAQQLRPTNPPTPARRLLMVDFEGGLLPGLEEAPTPEVSAMSGVTVDPVAQRVPQTKGWRAYVEHRAAPGVPEAEVSVRLTRGGVALSETWRGVVRPGG